MEFTERQPSSQFLDLQLTIEADGTLSTRLYEKPRALYLFIPPHSAHPPGVRDGHIFGNILRIFRLSTFEKDIIDDVVRFYHRFKNRGHPEDELQPLFMKAITNARRYLAQSKGQRKAEDRRKREESLRRLYFHLEFHPEHPPGRQLQQVFQDTLFCPPGKPKLNELETYGGATIPIDAMVIANHRAKNLGDILSYRDISKRDGPPVSSFL